MVVRIDWPAKHDQLPPDLHAVAAAIIAFGEDPTTAAIVLTGSAAFADIGDADASGQQAVADAITASPPRVVAAIGGYALGSGLALALVCHDRVAAGSARLGLPAIRAGALAASSTISRLAALVPLEQAIELLAFGTTLGAQAAQRCGLVDAVADGPVLDAALAFARERHLGGSPAADRGASAPATYSAGRFVQARGRLERRAAGQLAPLLALQALEHLAGASGPQHAGETAALGQQLARSEQGCALRYAAACVARRLQVQARADPPLPALRTICLVEPGAAGPELAMALAAAGADVVIATTTPGSVVATGGRRGQVRSGAPDDSADLMIAGAAASAEQWVAAVLGGARHKHIAASPLLVVARAPGAVARVTVHPYAPGGRLRLVEVSGALEDADPVLDLLRRTGVPVLHRAHPAAGVLIDRLRWPVLREAIHLLDEGATPRQVDAALLGFGFATAPLAAVDREGVASLVAACVDACAPRAAWRRYSATLDLLLDAGHLGAAVGEGWYRYEADRARPLDDPKVDRLLRESAMAQRLRRRRIADAEIVERCLLAAINEAAHALDDGADAEAIDALWTGVLGFPRWRGGLLYHADRIGLPRVVAGITEIQQMHGTCGPPARRLAMAVAAGASLS